MVLAIFHGENGYNCGIDTVEILEEEDLIRARYYPSWFQTGIDTRNPVFPKPGEHSTRSFAFAVVPRSGKALIFEEDVRRLIDGPPEWSGRGRLPGIGQ